MKPRAAVAEQPTGTEVIPAQVGTAPGNIAPVSPAVGGPAEQADLQAPEHSADLLSAGSQPYLPGLEVAPPTAIERRREAGRLATAGLGGTILRGMGLKSKPVVSVRESVRGTSDLAVGYSLEATDKARARGSSRGRQLVALGDTLKAGAGTILEDRSLDKVDKYSKRVIKNAAKQGVRKTRAKQHSRAAVRAIREGSPRAVTSVTKAAFESVRAGYSDWRVTRNSKKLAKQAPILDRRSGRVSNNLAKAVGQEARGNRRREEAGLKPMASVLNHDYVVQRARRSAQVAGTRRQAESTLAGRR